MQEKVDMAQSIINTFPVLKDPVTGGFVSALALASTCSTDGILKITDLVNICQTFGQTTRPTQPFILAGSIN